MASKYAAFQASSLAKKSHEQQKAKSATEFVKYSRALINFQILTLQSELQVLEELSDMPDNEKLSTLFDMLDKDGDGKLTAVELADGLRKIRGDLDFEESIALAIDRVASFDTDQDGVLDQKEFETLLSSILPMIGCTLHELTEMLVMQVLFSDSGNTLEEEAVAQVISEEITEEVKLDEALTLHYAMKDRRMKALFNVFDEDSTGSVDFKDVVVGMYKLLDGLGEASHAAVTALLLLDEKKTRELSYKDFARLLLNVVASSRMSFDDVADSLTLDAVRESSEITIDYVVEKLTMDFDTSSKLLLKISDDAEFIGLSVVELAKMDRLFAMINTKKDGRIGMKELALGLRKVQDSTGMKTTVEETIKVLHTFDKDEDGQLNSQEFAAFMINFASSANTPLVDMLDFMIVLSSLKENTAAEEEYMDSIGELKKIDSTTYG